ncbi:MAG: TSUP family transporter [Candidatus Obscuribacterales bacterium]|nr:TSUP family transporter [Candidatus Obscuribacterales bacterium]
MSSIPGVVTGALLGLLGGGGSIIAVPVMFYILGLETKTAIGSSLLIVGISSGGIGKSYFRDSPGPTTGNSL